MIATKITEGDCGAVATNLTEAAPFFQIALVRKPGRVESRRALPSLTTRWALVGFSTDNESIVGSAPMSRWCARTAQAELSVREPCVPSRASWVAPSEF